jgi:myo-inositol 2-dehydrogenase/D-chiro-inositol 1-dehydrogenase
VGEVAEVTATGAAVADPAIGQIGDVDHGVAVLRFANGALGVLDGGRAAGYGYEISTEVVGSQATVRVARHRRHEVEWLTRGLSARDYVLDFQQQFPEAYQRELEEFGRAVRGNQPVAVTGRDGVAAMLIARAAQRSLAEGRPVAVEPLPASIAGGAA